MIARFGVFPLVAAIALAVSACTMAVPEPSASRAPATRDAKPMKEPAPSSIEPVIVVAGVDVDGRSVTVSGYIAGIVEDGGKCEYLLHRAESPDVHELRPGQADRATTSCGSVAIGLQRLTRGEWNVNLRYTSLSEETFVSSPAKVEVP